MLDVNGILYITLLLQQAWYQVVWSISSFLHLWSRTVPNLNFSELWVMCQLIHNSTLCLETRLTYMTLSQKETNHSSREFESTNHYCGVHACLSHLRQQHSGICFHPLPFMPGYTYPILLRCRHKWCPYNFLIFCPFAIGYQLILSIFPTFWDNFPSNADMTSGCPLMYARKSVLK